MNNHVFVTKGDLEETIQDFMPPAYPHEIELQNLVAVLECTSREMVPRRFREHDPRQAGERDQAAEGAAAREGVEVFSVLPRY